MRLGTFLAWLCVATVLVTLVVGAAPRQVHAGDPGRRGELGRRVEVQ